jgi:mono/diheme cytochrome c family protein
MKLSMLKIISLGILFITVGGFTFFDQQKPWPVPEKYNKMANPVKADEASLGGGKAIWVKHCQSCHGKQGKGDGTKAAELDTEPGDFTKPSVQSETDGAFFYKTIEGREDMPSFKKKIPDEEDIWNVVNYIRTFKK